MEQRESALRNVDAELAQVAISVVAAEKDVQRGRQEIHDIQEQHRVVSAELEDASAQLAARQEDARCLEEVRHSAVTRRDECGDAVANFERLVTGGVRRRLDLQKPRPLAALHSPRGRLVVTRW